MSLLLCCLAAAVGGGVPLGPPTGAVYAVRLPLPFEQVLSIEVLSRSAAAVHLDGVVNHRGTARYRLQANGRVEVQMCEETRKLLRRLKVGLRAVIYSADTDSATVLASALFLPIMTLKLARVYS
jgi:hypothetical protein